jgi:hypothetical protein
MQIPLKNGMSGVKVKPYIDKPIKKEASKNKNIDDSDVIKKSKLAFEARS